MRFANTYTQEEIDRLIQGRENYTNTGGLDLAQQTLQNLSFASKTLPSSNFYHADLFKSSFYKVDATQSNFAHANLECTDFTMSDVSHADFSGVDMREAICINGTFQAVNFSGADLRGVDFSGADLSEANLSEADCTGAIFDGAILRGCKVERTEFKGVHFKDTNLMEVAIETAKMSSPSTTFSGVQCENIYTVSCVRIEETEVRVNYVVPMDCVVAGDWSGTLAEFKQFAESVTSERSRRNILGAYQYFWSVT